MLRDADERPESLPLRFKYVTRFENLLRRTGKDGAADEIGRVEKDLPRDEAAE